MNWIAPGIETNVAYGTCMLLFGLLVLSVRNRKMATRIPYTFYASPLRATARPTPRNKSAHGLRRATTPVQPSTLFLSSGLGYATPEKASPKVPENFGTPLATPLEFPAVTIPEEVKMNSPSFPFESLDPVALADISAFALPAEAPAIQESVPASLSAYGLAEIEERIAQEIALAMDRGVAQQIVPDMPMVAEANTAEQFAIEEEAIAIQAAPVEPACEKTAAPDVLTFYGLPQQPFDVTPDPAYLYSSPSHREALSSLKEGIEHFRGFMVLVAEPGMGKTTVLHKLMEELTESARVVFLFQTQCSSRELLCFILNELEVDHAGMDVVAMHRALNQALLEEMLRGRRFVLVVDEAQNLQEPVLETIRLLSDFETTHSKLIQIVLAGQPQLADTLMRPSLVQLRQRIGVLSNLKSLSAAETSEYIEYRLRSSGWTGDLLFTSDALAQIAETSGGVPRSINHLCFNAMLAAFHRGLEVIDAEIVKEVAEKLNLESLVRRPQVDADSQPSAAPAETIGTSQLARALAAALNAEAGLDPNSGSMIGPKPKPEVVLTGNLTEKVRSQGWSKRHEYRILVTLERDPISGLPVADRYYCCSIYMDEPQAAGLKAGKPVRIKIEQD
jgi:general secretion pathway protein A